MLSQLEDGLSWPAVERHPPPPPSSSVYLIRAAQTRPDQSKLHCPFVRLFLIPVFT